SRLSNRQRTQTAAVTATSYPNNDIRSYLFTDDEKVDELYNQLFKHGSMPSSTQVQTGRQGGITRGGFSFGRGSTESVTYGPETSSHRKICKVEQHLANKGGITHVDLTNWGKVYKLLDELAARNPTFPIETVINVLRGHLKDADSPGFQLDGQYVSIIGRYQVVRDGHNQILFTAHLPTSPDSAESTAISIRCPETNQLAKSINFDTGKPGEAISIAATCIGQINTTAERARQLDVLPIVIFK